MLHEYRAQMSLLTELVAHVLVAGYKYVAPTELFSVDVWWPNPKNLPGTTIALESLAATIDRMPTPFTRRSVTSRIAEDS
jgi:hypothetical protein